MLYDRWRDIASSQKGETALVDLASGRRWTFGQLARLSEQPSPEPHLFPSGHSPDFVRSVLAGWREGKVVCPLEPGEDPPSLAGLPAGVTHVKRTSGTSQAPRYILFRAEQLWADADQICRTMGLKPSRPNLGLISLAHSYGFSNLVLPLLLHGVPLWLVDSPMPEQVRKALGRGPRWTLPAVPALWRAWHEAGILGDSIELAISAGAPLPLSLETAVLEHCGLKIHNFYGASECGGIAFDDSDELRGEASLAGRPLDGVEVSEGSEGCLEVRGAAVAEGYWPTPGVGLGAGRYRTQDLGLLKGGEVHLTGRAGDVMNVAGRKVSPDTLETLLLACPAVLDCLVFGMPRPDSERGDEIVACLVIDDAGDEKRARDWMAERAPSWQQPRHWWRVDSLGTSQRGKRSRKHWRERFVSEQGWQA